MPWITAWQGVSRADVVSGDHGISAAIAELTDRTSRKSTRPRPLRRQSTPVTATRTLIGPALFGQGLPGSWSLK